MSVTVTLQLPEDLAQRARAIALQTQRPLEEVLVDWLDRAGTEVPVESLSNEQILALCDSQLDPDQQETLGELLARNRESLLKGSEGERLEELMQIYRRGLVRKAKALRIAVERGLRPPLS
jgi:hypothetical protein